MWGFSHGTDPQNSDSEPFVVKLFMCVLVSSGMDKDKKKNRQISAGNEKVLDSPDDINSFLDQFSIEVLEAVLSILRAQQEGRKRSQVPTNTVRTLVSAKKRQFPLHW